jgi:hypothetical protein
LDIQLRRVAFTLLEGILIMAVETFEVRIGFAFHCICHQAAQPVIVAGESDNKR